MHNCSYPTGTYGIGNKDPWENTKKHENIASKTCGLGLIYCITHCGLDIGRLIGTNTFGSSLPWELNTDLVLLSVQQLLAVPVPDYFERNRLELLKKIHRLSGEGIVTPEGSGTEHTSPTGSSPLSRLQPIKISPKWLPGYLNSDIATTDMNTAHPEELAPVRSEVGVEPQQRGSRGRRNANSGVRGGQHHPHHPQLMRVGCVLGTCQVQNLSHRLYQLIGQSGREDTSPINPRSPHSYG
ncbi:hypothetical protein DPEC_G00112790 [Dallia pectoralis]|uniref:Uncharacterized protein n=1 Tax=Dallia pectoralis TaxID=75939 RepID=A0ACC2GTL1_DALPE|nr:hypothetical protein DPEC_G00112790 [Dallia pectoralis]